MRLHVLRVMHANSQTETAEIPEGWGRIYAMADPRNPRLPVYVGLTTTELRRRLWSHYSEARKKKHENRPVSIWLRKMKSEGIRPVIYTLEVAPKESLLSRENYWIVFFRPLGTLLNAHDGIGEFGEPMKQRGGTREATLPFLTAANESRKKPVINDAGERFESIAKARKAIGVSEAGFRQCMRSGWKCKGHHWKFSENPN